MSFSSSYLNTTLSYWRQAEKARSPYHQAFKEPDLVQTVKCSLEHCVDKCPCSKAQSGGTLGTTPNRHGRHSTTRTGHSPDRLPTKRSGRPSSGAIKTATVPRFVAAFPLPQATNDVPVAGLTFGRVFCQVLKVRADRLLDVVVTAGYRELDLLLVQRERRKQFRVEGRVASWYRL